LYIFIYLYIVIYIYRERENVICNATPKKRKSQAHNEEIDNLLYTIYNAMYHVPPQGSRAPNGETDSTLIYYIMPCRMPPHKRESQAHNGETL